MRNWDAQEGMRLQAAANSQFRRVPGGLRVERVGLWIVVIDCSAFEARWSL